MVAAEIQPPVAAENKNENSVEPMKFENEKHAASEKTNNGPVGMNTIGQIPTIVTEIKNNTRSSDEPTVVHGSYGIVYLSLFSIFEYSGIIVILMLFL